MALKSSNIANTLLQTLNRLTAQGDALLITRETAKPVQTLVTVCTILVDSAETVAETTAEPQDRDRTFLFAKKIRQEVQNLAEVKKDIEFNANNSTIRPRLLSAAKNITLYTSQMLSIGDEPLFRKVIEHAKQCAQDAKIMIASTDLDYDHFFEACKNFGGSTLELAKYLQEIARKVEDRNHQQKVINSYNSIKEIGPQMIRASKRAYENPSVVEIQQELHQLARTFANKVSYAISVAQSDGGKVQNELSATQPVIPIPESDPLGNDMGGRRRTVKEKQHGSEILQRTTTATVAREISNGIEQASKLRVKEAERRSMMVPPGGLAIPPEPKNLKPDQESFLSNLEQDFDKEEPITPLTRPSTMALTPLNGQADETEMQKLREEIRLLREENESLHKVVATMQKRLDLRTE